MTPTPVRELHATWVDGAPAFWCRIGSRVGEVGELHKAAVDVFPGASMWLNARSRVDLRLPSGPVTAAVLRPAPGELAESLLHRRRLSDPRTPSVRWLEAMAALAGRSLRGRRVVPGLDHRITDWRARWVPIPDDVTAAALEQLAQAMPPVLLAAGRGTPPQARDLATLIFNWFADGMARQSLYQLSWMPDAGPSRSAPALTARRFLLALASPVPVFVAPQARHEEAAETIRQGLAAFHDRLDEPPGVEVQLRLVPPFDDPDPWVVTLEVASLDDPSLVVPATEVWTTSDAARLVATTAGQLAGLRRALAGAAARSARAVPALRELATSAQPSSIELAPEAVAALLDALPSLERAGVRLLVPAELVGRRRAKVRGKATPRPQGNTTSGLSGAALADVDWRVVIDDTELDLAELDRLATAKSPLVEVRGRWIRVDADELARAADAVRRRRAEHAVLGAADLVRVAAGLDDGLPAPLISLGPVGRTAGELPDLRIELEAGAVPRTGAVTWLAPDASDQTAPPPSWVADLLSGLPDDHLREVGEPDGFTGSLRHYQRRGLAWLQFLARLGLGGCLADDMGLGKTATALALIAADHAGPTLVVCPLSVVRTWETETARFTPGLRVHVHHGPQRAKGTDLADRAAAHDLVVTTYPLLARDANDLAAIDWHRVVLDEAQAVKNPLTNAAKAVRRLRAHHRVALTGTPVENHLGELWAVLDAVSPGLLGSRERFNVRFARPIERDADPVATDKLRRLTQPFILRRLKTDRRLLPDLPDKVESTAWCHLTREQAGLYKVVVDQLLASLDGLEGMSRRGAVLAALTKLKQICNHPAHFLGDGSRLSGRSGKLARFDELIEELDESGERALVFTQFVTMGHLLGSHLAARYGVDIPFLHGGLTKKRRDDMVQAFQADEGPPLLLVSLKAGGTGLTLTAASRVIHYDRWWNPAVEDQATDRVHRIGQLSTVFVHKLVTQGTIEERVDDIISGKRALAERVVGSGEAWLTELSTDALRDLLMLSPAAVGEAG